MRILLIHKYRPAWASEFDWMELITASSGAHEVVSTWWVVERKDALDPQDAAGVLTGDDFRSFAPDLLLVDGSPDARERSRSARKVPWGIERRFRETGGATIFLRAVPDMNDWSRNSGYEEYAFRSRDRRHRAELSESPAHQTIRSSGLPTGECRSSSWARGKSIRWECEGYCTKS